ncbi:MAG: FAD:protein FMN transferase [Planctomycetota bacterium]|nr:FAD:protein FMN transferase [Planctomycetota bacterium]
MHASDSEPGANIVPESAPPAVRLACAAMGTRFEFVLPMEQGPEAQFTPSELRGVAEEAIGEILSLHTKLSWFSPTSLLNLVNARAAEQPVPIDRDSMALLQLCQEIHEASEGAFDPTVAPLLEYWGFRLGPRAVHTQTEPLEHVRERVGFGLVALDPENGTVAFLKRGVSLDLGSVAKGWALDEAGTILRARGISRALVHGGTSSVLAIGVSPNGPWRVALALPPQVEGPDCPRAVVSLQDSSLSVSAPHGRVVESPTGVLGHVIDPRRGEPARGALLACAIAPSAAATDAWSTAMLVCAERPVGMQAQTTSLILNGERRWQVEGPLRSEISWV